MMTTVRAFITLQPKHILVSLFIAPTVEILHPIVKCTPQRKDRAKPVNHMKDPTLDSKPNKVKNMAKNLKQKTILEQ